MAANTYTTSDLVDNILLISHIPLSNATFTASNLIDLANRELQTSLIKQILSVREGYYMTYEDQPINALGLYYIPQDSIAGALANIELIQSTTIIPVNRITESEQFSTISPTSSSYGFFMQGNQVQILPTPNIGTVRMWYLRRPNTLVATTDAAQIAAITGNVLTVNSLPSDFIDGTLVSLNQDQPTFNMLGNREIAGISSLDVTLDLAVDDLAIGDWLALKNQTPVPQVPVEFRPLLEQRVAVQVFRIQGYMDKMNEVKKVLEQMEMDLFALISPRVQSQTKIINPTNGGFLGMGRNFSNFPASRNG